MGEAYNGVNKFAHIAEEQIRIYSRQFSKDIIVIYGKRFLNRRRTRVELSTIESEHGAAGFVECGGAIVCIKLIWKNIRLEEKGQYHKHRECKMSSIVAECWCDMHLYIWNRFVDREGHNSDLIVLAVFSLVQDIVRGTFPFLIEIKIQAGEIRCSAE